MKKVLLYGAILIGGYVLVVNSTGAGTLINDATSGVTGLAKTLQGR